MKAYSSDVAFSDSVKAVQTARGSRAPYARVEQAGGFEADVNEDLRGFLAEVDTAYLATASKDGQPYVQHRGGAKGFIRALDDHTLAFVDYVGNRQYVTTGNLLENDRVCLFLMDYAHRARIKIWGHAKAVPMSSEYTHLMPTTTVPGTARARPEQVILVHVTAWDANCPQHIPQKVDAREAASVIASLEERVRTLETENARLMRKREKEST